MYSASSSVMSMAQWVAFFRNAGLPQDVASKYALIFRENRIQVDMLPDLNKEYLFDMGIKVMGDVIAILKTAKEFYNKLSIRKMGDERQMPKKPAAISTNTAVAGRMVGHYTRSVAPTPITAPQDTGFQKKSTIISLKRKAEGSPRAAKIRRVPPEEEGAYKILMPLGTTEKTRRILQQQQKGQSMKRSVFTRLGDSAVSSSTDSNISSSVFERLGPSSDDMPSSTVTSDFEMTTKKGPVLQYRGILKTGTGGRQTVFTPFGKKANLPARTVLKPTGLGRQPIMIKTNRQPNMVKTTKLNQINTILQANKPQVFVRRSQRPAGNSALAGRLGVQKMNIKNRLGGKVGVQNQSRANILKRVAPQQTTVFDRLGR